MKVLLNGTDITKLTNKLQFTSNIESLSTICSFTIPQFVDTDFNVAIDLPSKIEIERNGNKFFVGVIVDITQNDTKFCEIKAMDVAFYLNRNKIFKQSRNTSGKNFIKSIVGEFGLDVSINGLDTTINKIYKNESVSDVIRDIAKIDFEATGKEYCIYAKETTIHINELGKEKAKLTFELSKKDTLNDKATVIGYTKSKNIENLVNAVSVYSDNDKSTKLLAKDEDKGSISKFGRIHEVIELQALENKKAKSVASAVVKAKSKIKETLSIVTAIDDYIFAGQGIKYDNKDYIVTNVDISFNNNYFTGTLNLTEVV